MLLKTFKVILIVGLGALFVALLLGEGTYPKNSLTERARIYTRKVEFNFTSWTLAAVTAKLEQAALASQNYLDADARQQLVLDYLQLTRDIQIGTNLLNEVYSDPNIDDPATVSKEIRQTLDELQLKRSQLAPEAEAILQGQINDTASELGLAVAGQAIPPVLFRSTPIPWALIISPRDTIDQEASFNLIPELRVEQHEALEDRVDAGLNVSSLVVPIGGIGLYPTMIYETSDLFRLVEVAAHEWVHNFLTLRPLGLNYMGSPELRTINETAASIAGDEIGRAVVERYYPEFLPKPPPPPAAGDPSPQENPDQFDFYLEMRETRMKVDELLAKGQVDEAEEYMEQRRKVFWENGYHLRKLNQAYFAFHGAYADHPSGGAAGEDPVGAAVRRFRQQSPSLEAFLKQIAWVKSFEELRQTVESRQDAANGS